MMTHIHFVIGRFQRRRGIIHYLQHVYAKLRNTTSIVRYCNGMSIWYIVTMPTDKTWLFILHRATELLPEKSSCSFQVSVLRVGSRRVCALVDWLESSIEQYHVTVAYEIYILDDFRPRNFSLNPELADPSTYIPLQPHNATPTTVKLHNSNSSFDTIHHIISLERLQQHLHLVSQESRWAGKKEL